MLARSARPCGVPGAVAIAGDRRSARQNRAGEVDQHQAIGGRVDDDVAGMEIPMDDA